MEYPFRGIVERGGWSLDYFTTDYVRRVGFSPHQNIVMTFLGKDKEVRPYCRILEQGNIWLLKLDMAKEGYNPED